MTKQLCRLVDTLRRILIPPPSLNRLESSRVSLSGRESAGSKGGSSNFDLLSFLPSKLPPSPARNPSGPLRWILRQTTKPSAFLFPTNPTLSALSQPAAAPHPLIPPPPPPAPLDPPPPLPPVKTEPSLPSAPPPQHLDWPFNQSGLLCYFDPFSDKAATLRDLLEVSFDVPSFSTLHSPLVSSFSL